MDRPVLTFPDKEAELVKTSYQSASVVLEYGSGGSTVFAAEQAGLRCFSVETDMAWANNLETWINDHVSDHGVTMHHVDIGDTKAWGYPKKYQLRMQPAYHRYRQSVWDLEGFAHPDIVLIDGRFRVGCFFATLANIQQDTTILFDDYANRKYKDAVERFIKPSRMAGRMAEFKAEPRKLSKPELFSILKQYTSAK